MSCLLHALARRLSLLKPNGISSKLEAVCYVCVCVWKESSDLILQALFRVCGKTAHIGFNSTCCILAPCTAACSLSLLSSLTCSLCLCLSQGLIKIIRHCLEQAEKLKMTSLSFPAIGTGNLSFPRDLVSRVLLKEIHSYSHKRTPHHLTEVAIVVHPSDSQTVDVSFWFVETAALLSSNGPVSCEFYCFYQTPRNQPALWFRNY